MCVFILIALIFGQIYYYYAFDIIVFATLTGRISRNKGSTGFARSCDYQTHRVSNRVKTSVDCGIVQHNRRPWNSLDSSGNIERKSRTMISMLGNDPRWSAARSDEIMESFSAGIWAILETAVSFSSWPCLVPPLTFNPIRDSCWESWLGYARCRKATPGRSIGTFSRLCSRANCSR